jgi:hypothetical protein
MVMDRLQTAFQQRQKEPATTEEAESKDYNVRVLIERMQRAGRSEREIEKAVREAHREGVLTMITLDVTALIAVVNASARALDKEARAADYHHRHVTADDHAPRPEPSGDHRRRLRRLGARRGWLGNHGVVTSEGRS